KEFLPQGPMMIRRTTVLIAMFIAAVLLVAAKPSSGQKANDGDLDRSIKPGNDFYHYANGGWLRKVTIPAGQWTFDTRAIVNEKTSQRVRDLIQNAAAANSSKGSVAQKVGDYYFSFMDQAGIEAAKLTPLVDELSRIGGISNKASLSGYLGTTLNAE